MRNLEKFLSPQVVVLTRGIAICFVLISGLSTALGQTTYYLANSGNDTNTGRSSDSPYQTVAKINSLSLQPGDQVLFRRGDTFRGNLQLRQSGSSARPISIDAYGSGNKPVLTGSVPISNWTNTGNNTWQANCPACGDRVTGLYRANAALPLGRYPNLNAPNKGYLTVQSHTGKTQLTSQQSLPTNWTGGEAVFRPVQWILNRARITGQTGSTLTLDGSGSYDISDNWGYFIQNHPATLDQTGEWYYNPVNKTIRLFDNQTNPNSQSITVTVLAEAVSLSGVSFVNVRNLRTTQTLSAGLSITDGSNLIIASNDITQSGEDGLLVQGSGQQLLIENNLIEDINNNGVSIPSYQQVTFRRNIIQRIGLIPGRGKSGDGTYVGFQSTCTANTLIEDNVVDNIGYNALTFSTRTTIQRNRISNFCRTKSDGSGLYIWNGNRQPLSDIRLRSNIVYNGIGAPEGTPGGAHSGANGIYLDDCTTNIEVTGNSVHDCRGYGLFLHGSSSIRLTGNTAYNNGEGQLLVTGANGCQPRNNVIENNILFSRLPTQPVVAYESNANDLAQYGPFDRNYYARPFNDLFKISAIYNPGSGLTGATLSLAEWQARWGKDANSANSPLTYPTQAVTQTGTTVLNQAFGTNANGWSGWSPYGNGRVDWDNANRLDGGSLRLSFASASNQSNSTLLTWVSLGAITKGNTYQLLFDGLASGAGKRVQVYPRQLSGGYQDLAARASFALGTTRQAYEATFTATANESNAILIVQVEGEGQTAWLDNIRLREATLTTLNPDDYIKLVYNPTPQEKTEPLNGVYRDVKNTVYNRQVSVAPYASVVLLKEINPTTPPPPPTTTLRNPENPTNAVTGLDYGYYEGYWNVLPDFNALTPVKTGTTGSADPVAVRNRPEGFALRYQGYLNVPTDGVYTLYTTSDDGSKLLIGSTEVVSNDGLHGLDEKSGTIGLKAGKHALTLLYMQGGWGQGLTVSYQGPGIGKQTIPATAFFRMATTPPPRPAITLRNPENPANTVGGLDYQYYEGNWNVLPDFNALTPVKTGTASSADPASVRNRQDDFALRYQGYISVPTDGVYTFFTTSDDGSKFFIGSTEVVSNDGLHGLEEKSGTIGLKAGRHALTLLYMQGGWGQGLTVSYQGPGIGKQTIPATAFFRMATTGGIAGTGTGLRAEYFNNADLAAPVVLSRVDATVDFDWGTDSPAPGAVNTDNFSVRWTGQVQAPITGRYVFSTLADDGVRLWVNGVLLLNDWTGHPPQTHDGPSIALTAGQRYDIRLEYFDGASGAVAKLLWAYPGQGSQVIPQVRLYPATSGRVAADGEAEPNALLMQVYPVPAQESAWIRYYAETAGEATVQLVNSAAQPVLRTLHPVIPGENLLKMAVGQLPRGSYVLTLTQNQQRLSRRVLLTE